MLLLFPETVPGVVSDSRSTETKAFVYGKSVDLAFEGFELVVWPCHSFADYELGMYSVWDRAAKRSEGFMILEQDVVPPSIGFLKDMAACPERFCAVPVEDHDNRPEHDAMKYAGSPWACSAGTEGCRPGPTAFSKHGESYLVTTPEDNYAHSVASAILKVGPQLTQRVLDLGPGYSTLDSRLNGFLTGRGLIRRIHLHWPEGRQLVRHNHLVCRGDL